MKKLLDALKKDAWLVVLLGVCVAGCLMLKGGTAPTAALSQEARLGRVLSAMQGAGTVEVALYYPGDEAALPCGAVVVADGAGDIAVQLRLTRAVATLLGIDMNQVEVFQRKVD